MKNLPETVGVVTLAVVFMAAWAALGALWNGYILSIL